MNNAGLLNKKGKNVNTDDKKKFFSRCDDDCESNKCRNNVCEEKGIFLNN